MHISCLCKTVSVPAMDQQQERTEDKCDKCDSAIVAWRMDATTWPAGAVHVECYNSKIAYDCVLIL